MQSEQISYLLDLPYTNTIVCSVFPHDYWWHRRVATSNLPPVDLVHQIMCWYAYLMQDPMERIAVSVSRHLNTLIG